MLYLVCLAVSLMMWQSLKVTFLPVPIHLTPPYHSRAQTYTRAHFHTGTQAAII